MNNCKENENTKQTRKKNRLSGYDYSQNGAYFITICAHNHKHLFGEIENVGEGFPLPSVQLNSNGKKVNEYIGKISAKYVSVKIEKYVIMPNHVHLIILINGDEFGSVGQNPDNGTGNPSPTVGNIVGWFKYQTTKTINEMQNTPGVKLWQRSYHDHIIRTEKSYGEIWQYIDTNPLKWQDDCYHTYGKKAKQTARPKAP